MFHFSLYSASLPKHKRVYTSLFKFLLSLHFIYILMCNSHKERSFITFGYLYFIHMHVITKQRGKERCAYSQTEFGWNRVECRWNTLQKEKYAQCDWWDFWTAFFRLRNWVQISGYFFLSDETWRKCDMTTLQMVWMISFQKRILLNPPTTCFQSYGALVLLYKHASTRMHMYRHVHVYGSWCHKPYSLC